MSFLTYLVPFLLSVLLIGCSEPPPEEPAATSRPVKTIQIKAQAIDGVRSFPARIDAGSKAEIAFRIPGTVQELPVKEGQAVDKDQVLAELDKTDYQLVVNDRKAVYDNARQNFKRAEELIKDGYISKMDYDRLNAEFKSSRAALETAQQDLNYTTLKAPFEGIVAKLYIDAFQEVQAKQVILDLHDVSLLDVKIDVPENIVRAVRIKEKVSDEEAGQVPAHVSFANLPDESFKLTYKEAAIKADPQTQTYQVTYSMEQLQDRTILSGMTAMVTVDLSKFFADNTLFTIPGSAITGDYKLAPKAWVVDEKNMVVQSRPVKVGRLLGDNIEVLDGLESGERIVTAGTAFLVDGMKVTLLEQPEQAQPRSDEQNQ